VNIALKDIAKVDERDNKEERYMKRFGKVRRGALSRKIVDKKKESLKETEQNDTLKIDLELLAKRIREELFRQLKRELSDEKGVQKSKAKIDMHLLEEQIREELSRQLGKHEKAPSVEREPSGEPPLDKALLEEAVREALDHFLGKDKSQSVDQPETGIDLALLESRVRGELLRKLGKEPETYLQEGEKIRLPDRAMLEARIREVVAMQLKGLSNIDSGSVDDDWKSRIDMDLVEGQIRNVLKKCLEDLYFALEWNLTDEDLERIIRRTLM